MEIVEKIKDIGDRLNYSHFFNTKALEKNINIFTKSLEKLGEYQLKIIIETRNLLLQISLGVMVLISAMLAFYSKIKIDFIFYYKISLFLLSLFLILSIVYLFAIYLYDTITFKKAIDLSKEKRQILIDGKEKIKKFSFKKEDAKILNEKIRIQLRKNNFLDILFLVFFVILFFILISGLVLLCYVILNNF